MEQATQYMTYILPSRAPPSRLFGPVRTILYILIFASYGYVFAQIIKHKLPGHFAVPFIINLVANFAFTYLQFSLQNYRLAAIDTLIILGTIIRTMVLLRPKIKRAFRLQIPYLLWVTFASVLAITIALYN